MNDKTFEQGQEDAERFMKAMGRAATERELKLHDNLDPYWKGWKTFVDQGVKSVSETC